MKEPTSTPPKNKEIVSGAFQSSSHTRFHCKRSKGMYHSLLLNMFEIQAFLENEMRTSCKPALCSHDHVAV